MTRNELKDLIGRHESTTFPQDYGDRMAARGRDWEAVAAAAHADRGALLDLARQLEAALASLQPDFCPLCGDPECPAPILDVLRGDAEEENDR